MSAIENVSYPFFEDGVEKINRSVSPHQMLIVQDLNVHYTTGQDYL